MKIIIIVILILFFIFLLLNHLKKKKFYKNNISFDEFDDIDELKKQELLEKQTMEYESAVLNKVYKDTYHKYSNNSFSIYTHARALMKAQDAIAKTRKNLYNFRFLDSVKPSKEETIKEGTSIKALKENGNNFDVELFKKWSRQIFGCIKIGTNEQLSIVKNFISEELYHKFQYQVKQFEKDDLSFVTGDLIINNCKIYDYSKSLDKEQIIVLIDSTMQEYIIRKKDNKVIRGSKTEYYNKKVLMTFIKKKSSEKEGFIRNCPNCGGKIDLVKFGKCNYCGTLIFPIRYNWTLTKFETV